MTSRLGEVTSRLQEEGAAFCVAVADNGVLAGIVQGSALDANPGLTIEAVMEFGVTTVRPSEEVGPLRERMSSSGVRESWSRVQTVASWASSSGSRPP